MCSTSQTGPSPSSSKMNSASKSTREKYQSRGGSKVNLLRGFIDAEDGYTVGRVLRKLWEHRNHSIVAADPARALPADVQKRFSDLVAQIEAGFLVPVLELALGLPEKIKGLFAAVRKPLGLSSNRADFDPLIADEVRKILNGLATVVGGIGALRTHGGDAHGRERGMPALTGGSRVSPFTLADAPSSTPTKSLELAVTNPTSPSRSIHSPPP